MSKSSGSKSGGTDKPYRVGRGKPPLHSRWKKGQPSPNPNGRPCGEAKSMMKDPELSTLAMRIVEMANVPIVVNGDETPRIEAAFLKLQELGFRGNRQALTDLIRLTNEAAREITRVRADRFSQAMNYKAKYGPRFAEAERLGKPVPNVLPHPDDVIVNKNGDVLVLGPQTEEQRRQMDVRIRVRDLFGEDVDFLQWTLAKLRQAPHPISDDLTKPSRHLRRYRKLDSMLPPRLRRRPAGKPLAGAPMPPPPQVRLMPEKVLEELGLDA